MSMSPRMTQKSELRGKKKNKTQKSEGKKKKQEYCMGIYIAQLFS